MVKRLWETSNTLASPLTKRVKYTLQSDSSSAVFCKLAVESSEPSVSPTPNKGTATHISLRDKDLSQIYEDISPPRLHEIAPQEPEDMLPERIQDLMNIHSAFVTTLSVHIREDASVHWHDLSPSIANVWKKRRIELDDIRRCVVGHPSMTILDYGGGNVHLKMLANNPPYTTAQHFAGYVSGFAAKHTSQVAANMSFVQKLRRAWADWTLKCKGQDPDVDMFMRQLPLAELVDCSHLRQVESEVEKGRQRPQEITILTIDSQEGEVGPPAPAKPVTTSPPAVADRGSALRQRIHARQKLASALPPPPLKADLERKAALDRVEEVFRVLVMLVGAKARASFSLEDIVQRVRDSVRKPLSRTEVVSTLEIVAKELAPNFLNFVSMGGPTGVALIRDGKPSFLELQKSTANLVPYSRDSICH
ncbi:hypothetical protein B0A49_11019 [Cryomyces minteri]|uniref:DNA replication factor Cdt1 C-terminal domain-containing protein n=1 Tax=Cryomyces minteri TaxID=331657 RepID=A0A4U0WMH8_9PEZI|nr:hypothetical protein B0A49_11019 [Cryomyces minteri]